MTDLGRFRRGSTRGARIVRAVGREEGEKGDDRHADLRLKKKLREEAKTEREKKAPY